MFFHAALTPNPIPKLKEAGKATHASSSLRQMSVAPAVRFPVLRFGMEMTSREVCPHLTLAEAVQPTWLRWQLAVLFLPFAITLLNP